MYEGAGVREDKSPISHMLGCCRSLNDVTNVYIFIFQSIVGVNNMDTWTELRS